MSEKSNRTVQYCCNIFVECSINAISNYSYSSILIGTFCNCLSYKKFLIMASCKELSNSLKALIVKLWKDRESYRNISSNLNISFTTISSFIARFKDT